MKQEKRQFWISLYQRRARNEIYSPA